MTVLTKPVLRGHIQRRGLKTLVAAIGTAAFNVTLYYFLVAIPRKEKYDNFLKTYDGPAHAAALARGGYLQSTKRLENN